MKAYDKSSDEKSVNFCELSPQNRLLSMVHLLKWFKIIRIFLVISHKSVNYLRHKKEDNSHKYITFGYKKLHIIHNIGHPFRFFRSFLLERGGKNVNYDKSLTIFKIKNNKLDVEK